VAELSELGLATRAYLAAYRWRRIDPIPWSPLTKPLAAANVAIVSTAGMVLPDQQPFDNDRAGGDVTFREIASTSQASQLIDTHRSRSFDHTGIRTDPNLGFPIDRLRELAERGTIGRVNRRHLSFMGSITAPGRLIRDTAPAAAQLLVDDNVDAVLLVPV
jgi:D-proline reductase (dithiol) PrdB